jgi:hypothetical protein
MINGARFVMPEPVVHSLSRHRRRDLVVARIMPSRSWLITVDVNPVPMSG